MLFDALVSGVAASKIQRVLSIFTRGRCRATSMAKKERNFDWERPRTQSKTNSHNNCAKFGKYLYEAVVRLYPQFRHYCTHHFWFITAH